MEETHMTDPSPDTDMRPTEERPPSTPQWVKVFGIIGIVLVLLFVIMMLAGGNHGPGRHMPTGSAPTNGETLLASVVEHRLQKL